ncbi:hypothetical protein PR202_gb08540 [Eleusine coracana subsp. coracana]|uniref:Uncharacterized protein n=1 Tax=Eleusine coracana subsp. coracana TaxID=191504 RepID=A0AAV5EE73_ELECO|nr:hypothetical protein PR202_gb08540 [Eleusine coracana subsp. coracana]
MLFHRCRGTCSTAEASQGSVGGKALPPVQIHAATRAGTAETVIATSMCARRSSENRERKREEVRGDRGEREGELTVVAGRRLRLPCPEPPKLATTALPQLAPPPRCPRPYTPEGKARAAARSRSVGGLGLTPPPRSRIPTPPPPSPPSVAHPLLGRCTPSARAHAHSAALRLDTPRATASSTHTVGADLVASGGRG